MPVDMDEIEYMVRTILAKYADDNECPPWPPDIIDQVFCAIRKSRFVYYPPYQRLTGGSKEDKNTVNQQIGKMVKDITGLKVIREGCKSKSDGIADSYSELG